MKFKFLNKLFGSTNDRKINALLPIVEQINSIEKDIEKLSDKQLSEKATVLKEISKNNLKSDDILPEAFALVREASKRTIGQRHYDVQLMGGIILHQGKIAEMKTGEGKTLVATLSAFLNALSGKGVHIITVNDYLAKRDAEWMGKIYKFLGLTVGCLTSETPDDERKKIYESDIVYGTNNEFAFDYLRDNMKLSLEEMVQREFKYCIVDEVDSILIDEARTPLIISGPVEESSTEYFLCNKIINELNDKLYKIDEKDRNVTLNDQGIDEVEKKLKEINLLKGENFYDPRNLSLVHHINQSLKANVLFQRDKDYIIKDNSIQIIDEFTGRVLDGRRYSDGLHQAIEAKEGVPIQNENQTFASTTYQNYFRLYEKLSGMTGTAMTEASEFFDIYKLDVVDIPTNVNVEREDLNDQIYRTEKEKITAIIDNIKKSNQNGQPILVGTTSIEKSEELSRCLKENHIAHNVLNAKHHEKEASIIAQAGRLSSVTIATNMAGRGTDIQLGGNEELRKKESRDPQTEIELFEKEKKQVMEAGGLLVIGTERHESRRIDNQLRGRSGRQGDKGKTIFFLSLEDDLMRIFGSERIDTMLKKLGLKEGECIDHPWINKALEKAQQKVEARNFEIRKSLLQFDDVMSDQRKVIYEQRLEILKTNNIYHTTNNFFEDVSNNIIDYTQLPVENLDKSILKSKIERILGNKLTDSEVDTFIKLNSKDKITKLKSKFEKKRKDRINKVGDDVNKDIEKKIFLQNLDFEWRNHLQYLEQLRQVIGLRGYGQKNPIDEYKRESFSLFQNLLEKIKENIVIFLSNIEITIADQMQDDLSKDITKNQRIEGCLLNENKKNKIPRNEKCPATGKKFKSCCGSLI
ncbi:MAG: preprotein translocase subunit SecA [Candidatus Pelagibacter sp.]|nr:preprotein translocase subunit SecA [Candidatus Pelagibacter sp.]OUV88547.1 MAG: preprotein translocase subunit SecA [Pelagibacteraceae bacterium TMED136]|tara:strand:+ start:114 stop:2705 length:2592 start_codon:yes stop_codon:yes gene_type:complete